ncbi:hPr kinase/phosphorylase [Firmicutes bacterium CAG:313]|nr:hPr kinase/phosphorylase [Firmicutes bacterium CAG:313]
MNKVTLKKLVKELNLEVIYGNSYLERTVTKAMSSRPSVEMYCGYFDYFEKDRIQVIGTKELTLFNMLSASQKKERLAKLFSYNSPAFVFTKNVDAPKEFVEAAIACQIPIFKSKLSTSGFIGDLTNYLQSELAQRNKINGSMVEVFGVGVLIEGADGIGKSETVLELLNKGQIMISDDITKIYQPEPGRVVCEAPKERQGFMEIKDLGIIDVKNMYGIGAIRNHKNLQLVVELVKGETSKVTEETFFDTVVPKIQIEVEAGRNVATLVESAALNYRLKQSGYDAEEVYQNRCIHETYKGGEE